MKIASPAGMELAVVLALRDILLCVECLKAFFYAGVVDTQKLVLRGSHVDEVRLALATFLIEELVHRLICWGFSQVSADDLVQRFPQMRRAAFGCRYALMAFHPFPIACSISWVTRAHKVALPVQIECCE